MQLRSTPNMRPSAGKARSMAPCRKRVNDRVTCAPVSASSSSGSYGTRRELLAGLVVGTTGLALFTPTPPHASARTVVGETIAGWWKAVQRQNGGVKILAPIRVAEERLVAASASLDTAASPAELTAVLKAVRAASVNCYAFEALPGDDIETRASLITQKFVTTADPCTFRIIVKNVTSLSSEATKQEGMDLIQSIIQSFNLMDSYLEQGINGNPSKVDDAKRQIATSIDLVRKLDKFVEATIMTDAEMAPASR